MADRTVVVTGSTSGIGAAIATAFASDGADVVVNGRDEARTAEAAERIGKEAGGDRVRPVAADVSTVDGAQALTGAAPEVDVLVNNAGAFGPTPFAEITDDTWRHFFEANVLAGVRLARIYLPGMVSRGWGRIVFVSSESALNIPTDMIHYGVTKTAQIAAARGIAQEVSGTGVTVNSVLPGPTWTPGVSSMLDEQFGAEMPFEEKQRRFFAEARPTSIIQRFATPEEVAALVHYVGSDAASATTGAALRVDGGVVQSIVP